MTRWRVAGLALILFASIGCDVVATAVTARAIDAADDTDQNVSPFRNQRPIQQADLEDGEYTDLSKLSDHILTPVAVADSEKKTGPNRDSPSVQGYEPAVAPNEVEVAAVNNDAKTTLANPNEATSQLPDVALTIKPTPSPAITLVPTPYVSGSMSGEAPRTGPTATGGEDVGAPEPNQDCIRPGGMTLWLEPSGGEWTVLAGQSMEVDFCLSNLSTDLAGFDLTLKMERSGVAEFTGIKMGGFGLESYSELPTESLRVRAIDLMQQLNAGTDGILLATLLIESTGMGESLLTIEINAIDDKDGYSVTAQVLEASLRVTEG